MIGRDKSRASWRVLKVDRLEPFELNICEDSTTYSESECNDLLKRIHEGNMSTGGLKFVINCYGIVGFIRFLGPYYMLLITKRRLVGAICGHNVYAVTKSAMITVPKYSVRSNMAIPRMKIGLPPILYITIVTCAQCVYYTNQSSKHHFCPILSIKNWLCGYGKSLFLFVSIMIFVLNC